MKDDFGNTIQNLRDKLDIKLSDSTASQLATHPIQYETGFTLLPGKYVIKYLARDAETGRIGTYQMSFAIPNLNKEEKRVPISSVVLSSQRVPLGDSIYNVKQKIDAEAANPLVLDGQKLIPSVTRVFSKSRDLYVFLQAYERDATSTRPMVAFVGFYQGQVKAFETAPLAVSRRIGRQIQSRAAPIQPVARQASARPIRLPSDGVGSDLGRRRRSGKLPYPRLLYVLLPISIVGALVLVWQGVPQTLGGQSTPRRSRAPQQTIALGPDRLAGSDQAAGHQRRRVLQRQQRPSVREPDAAFRTFSKIC